jgi:hypothetical protein
MAFCSFMGGPLDGQVVEVPIEPGPVLAAHLDRDLRSTNPATSFAVARYSREAGGNTYTFADLVVPSGEPVTINFMDGPAQGMADPIEATKGSERNAMNLASKSGR